MSERAWDLCSVRTMIMVCPEYNRSHQEKEHMLLHLSIHTLYMHPQSSGTDTLQCFIFPLFKILNQNLLQASMGMDGKKLEYKGEDALRELEELTIKAKEVQDSILKEIITRNGASEYLNKYMQGSIDLLTFKTRVPVITYEKIQPYIQRIVNGEDSSIISGHQITEMLMRYISFPLFSAKFFMFFFPCRPFQLLDL